MVLGQDEIADGHAQALPSAGRSWSEWIMEAALYRGSVLSDETVLNMWDGYFTAVYGGVA